MGNMRINKKIKVSISIKLITFFSYVLAVSYNKPKFCPNASWNPNAITFANISTVGYQPYDVFVNTNNTVYVTNTQNSQVVVWSQGNVTPIRIISGNLSIPWSLFVTTSGDIYVDSDSSTGRVDQWILNSTKGTPTMSICKKCFDLFVDISNTLYCSMNYLHQVVKKSLNSNSNALEIVAGTGTNGFTSYLLSYPGGIFVDINFDLYVADSQNNRIQLFKSEELSGTTVAGNGSSSVTISLSTPTGVILDADKYLFIVDSWNHRIIGSGPNGFRCVAGCSGAGTASNQLYNPYTLSFDSSGNMFVTDYFNSRIQQFSLLMNFCDEMTTTQQSITSTANNINSFLSTITDELNDMTLSPSNKIVSYNQPKFCPNASWNPNGTPFADIITVGAHPYGIFINTNNMIYAINRGSGMIIVWSNNNINPTRIIISSLSSPWGIFVTTLGDIYVDNGGSNGRVDKFTLNANSSVPAMYVSQSCYGLFVDINDILYCSMMNLHQVITKPLNSNSNKTLTVAGIGCNGSTSNHLSLPHGIFVNTNFDLYVADYGNSRIQCFQSGQLSAITVAGNGSSSVTISLYGPTGVVLDADGYLFIVDTYDNRIIGSGPNGFRCVAGCSGSPGSVSNQLNYPQTLSFDSYGNMFVTDWGNNRVQKFDLLANSCDEYTTQTLTTTIVEETSSNPIKSTALPSSILSTIETTVFNQQGSTSISSIDQPTTTGSPLTFFVPPSCTGQHQIGLGCNISSAQCDLLKPCQNNGTCINDSNTLHGYICTCSLGFHGPECQIDSRSCKPNTCWNNGTCNETSNTTFQCVCQLGWTSAHCETMINYCENVVCLNNGVCRLLLLNYICKCLGTSYSGRHCEIVERTTVIRQIIAKSFGYIAILFILAVFIFVFILDILTNCFGIYPAKDELEMIRRKKQQKKVKRPPVILRFIYVNATPQPSPRTTAEGDMSPFEETSV